MTKTNKKLIAAIAIVLGGITVAGASIGLIAAEGNNAVTDQSAKEIALAHAGLKEAEVTMNKVKYDRDDGRKEYEIEFRKDGVKYEYEIDAESGEIVSFDSDVKASVVSPDGGAVTGALLTAEEAKATALAHAGLAEAEVSFTKVKLDRDDGCDEYEIDFYKDNVKYEYEIDALSGAVRSCEKEVKKVNTPLPVADKAPAQTADASADPAAPTPAEPTPAAPTPAEPTPVAPTPAAPSQITADQAKAAALAHAGLSEADVTFTKVKLERDDGRTEYEIEFRQGALEYEYEIDAESGEILDFEKEYDD